MQTIYYVALISGIAGAGLAGCAKEKEPVDYSARITDLEDHVSGLEKRVNELEKQTPAGQLREQERSERDHLKHLRDQQNAVGAAQNLACDATGQC